MSIIIEYLFYILKIYFITTTLHFIYKLLSIYYTIHKYEHENNSKIIFMRDINITRWNTIIYNILHFLFKDIVISINDDVSFRRILSKNSNKNIDIILESTGGYISSNDCIINFMDNHQHKINTYIHDYAMSAATMIALASDNIYMSNYAHQSPTDPQIVINNETYGLYSLIKLVENKNKADIEDSILLAYYDNLSLYELNKQQVSKYINKHSINKNNKKNKNKIIRLLTEGKLPHHTVLDRYKLSKHIRIHNPIPNDITWIYKNISYMYKYL